MFIDLRFYLAKIICIFLIGGLYVIFGSIVSLTFKKYITKPYNRKWSRLQNLLQLCYEIGLLMVLVYFIRLFIKKGIPNPFESFAGVRMERLKEINGNIILAFAFLIYLKDDIKSKIDGVFDSV